MDASTAEQLNRDRAARAEGTQRTRDHSNYQRSGGRAAGSYRGGGGGRRGRRRRKTLGRHFSTVRVRTDTECRGSSSENVSPAPTDSRVILTASGVLNPFTAASESATTRSRRVALRAAPRTRIRPVTGRSRSVLTALM